MSIYKFIIGAAVGVAAGYAIARMQEKGYFDDVCDNLNDFAATTKKNAKNLIDKGANELEYIKERAGYKVQEGKEKLDDAMR